MIELAPRCDEHAGNPYPARCRVCESLEAEWRALPVTKTEQEQNA